MTYRIVMLGAPGSGKGTQSKLLAKKLGVETISTGALFREQMAAGTELGQLARFYIDGGNLVPDSVTVPMVEEHFASGIAERGFILDGFPRTVAQALVLDQMLGEENPLTAVLELWVDAEEVVNRLLSRAEVEHRSDDTADVIRNRIEVYRESTKPLHDFYVERGILHEINAMGEIDEVTNRLCSVLRNCVA